MQWFHDRHAVLCGTPKAIGRVLRSRHQAWKQDAPFLEKTAPQKTGMALKDGPMILSGPDFQHPVRYVSGNLKIRFAFTATNDLDYGGFRFRVGPAVRVWVGLRKKLKKLCFNFFSFVLVHQFSSYSFFVSNRSWLYPAANNHSRTIR
jgi:hypothetical protein